MCMCVCACVHVCVFVHASSECVFTRLSLLHFSFFFALLCSALLCSAQGLTRKYDYFDGKVISIDKTNRTTLPGTELIMKDDNLAMASQDGGRDGLLIRCGAVCGCSD
jgi:hypothetical protein